MARYRTTTAAVATELGIGLKLLRSHMAACSDGPWIDVSRGKQPRYRWSDNPAEWWAWLEEACRVAQSTNETGSTDSGGASTAAPAPTPSRRSAARSSCKATASTPSRSTASGSLRLLVDNLKGSAA